MGGLLDKCFPPDPPPVVFTVCPSDGKAHTFSEPKLGERVCTKCELTKEAIDLQCLHCQEGDHCWQQELIPLQHASPQSQTPQGGVAQGMPVIVQQKCAHCGMRRRMEENGQYIYDDYYMYGGVRQRPSN